MKLTVLGSGTGWITSKRRAPGYLLSYEKFHLLLDLGPGTINQLLKTGLTINDISAIFISHFHPDHVTDLIPFLFAMNYRLGYTREEKIFLYAHKNFSLFYENLKAAFGHWICPPKELLEIKLIEKEDFYTFQLGPFLAKTIKVKHNPESLAIRLEIDKKSITYSGDTGFCEELITLSYGSDLLILECANSKNFFVPHHLGPEEIALVCERAKPKRVLLSHFYPHSEEVDINLIKERYTGEIILAYDLLTLNI